MAVTPSVPVTAADIAARMIQVLQVAEPSLDTSIGSVTRKILDVVAEQIAPAYAERYLSESIFDINAREGADLDDFCALFGIYRFSAKRATGVISFERPKPADRNYFIPRGTQVTDGGSPRVIFASVAPAAIAKGGSTVSVPIQAVAGGVSGNLPAGSLTMLASPVSGVSSRTLQAEATTGGVDAESDAKMRRRFRHTVFRSLAGTEDMFTALALEDSTPDNPDDTTALQVKIVGASSRWREQVQMDGDEASSSIPVRNYSYIFPNSEFFGPDIDSGQMLVAGIHYTFDPSYDPPKVFDEGDSLGPVALYDLDFEYVSVASRNDPSSGITNRVDIWVTGEAAVAASETTYFRTVAFSASSASDFHMNKYMRLDSADVRPTVGNLFLPLAFGPIVTFPDTLTIGATTYEQGVDYWVVHEDNAFGYGPTSRHGLEWLSSHHPATNAQIVLSGDFAYTYNRLPNDVENRTRKWRMVSTDVRAHAAKQIWLRLNFALMFDEQYSRSNVRNGIDEALATYLSEQGFEPTLQVSDLLTVAHNVGGVDNIRFTNSLEGTGASDVQWGIERVTRSGEHMAYYQSGTDPARVRDLRFSDMEVPVLQDIVYTTKAQNTFGEPNE